MTQKFENNPMTVLILGIVTCGIYLIYWNYKMSQALNEIVEREAISQNIAIFAGLCSPVNAYFYYLTGREIMPVIYKKNREPEKDQSTMLLILGIFLPMAAAMIVQGEVNKYYSNVQ